MIADTQAEVSRPGVATEHVSGVAKILFARDLLIALGGWGSATVAGTTLDIWLADFLNAISRPAPPLRRIGELLVAELSHALNTTSSETRRRGVHIAGFEDGLPALYHAHMGDPGGPPAALQLEDTTALKAAEAGLERRTYMRRSITQLRNGIYPVFQEHWDRDVALSGWGDHGSISARADHYRPLFRAVACVSPHIDNEVSLVGFTTTGQVIDELVAPGRLTTLDSDAWPEVILFRAA